MISQWLMATVFSVSACKPCTQTDTLSRSNIYTLSEISKREATAGSRSKYEFPQLHGTYCKTLKHIFNQIYSIPCVCRARDQSHKFYCTLSLTQHTTIQQYRIQLGQNAHTHKHTCNAYVREDFKTRLGKMIHCHQRVQPSTRTHRCNPDVGHMLKTQKHLETQDGNIVKC